MGIPSDQSPQIAYKKKEAEENSESFTCVTLWPGVPEGHASARTQNKEKRTRNTGFTTYTDVNFQNSLLNKYYTRC